MGIIEQSSTQGGITIVLSQMDWCYCITTKFFLATDYLTSIIKPQVIYGIQLVNGLDKFCYKEVQ